VVKPVGVEPDCPVCDEPFAVVRRMRRPHPPRVRCPNGHGWEVMEVFRQGDGRPLLLRLGARVDAIPGAAR